MAKRIFYIFALAALIMLIAVGAFVLQSNSTSDNSKNYDADSTVYTTIEKIINIHL